ncbi:PilZ domain-containing protein [Sphingosinicella soli]|uniref:PilZ domain-containing protein n=1 Tax=Sphingosinicella soli TaxID=333708 RepID=A0A7W7F7E9_9SPHN|nr:PilZ domain-containing protein [Sphingosinicella soli]MBB4633590.1 hypothetical protein [Sphingosinicella soli]
MSNDADNKRSATRAATNHLAGIQYRRGNLTARVIDMSMTGARLATHEQIAIGEKIVLTTVRMGARAGVVVRFVDGELGVRFTDEIAAAHEARMTPAG